MLRGFTDDVLMRLVCEEHDSAAFAVLYERHAGAAFSLALRMCGRRVVAEDVVQEAFLSLWCSGAGYDGERGDVRRWVLGIAHNRAVDALRRGLVAERAGAREAWLAERREVAEPAELEAGRRAEARELRAALVGLPPEQSRVIGLAYYGGFSHAEIAMMLGAPVGTIKGRMRLGLQKMRFQLTSQLGARGGGGRRIRSGPPWPPATATPRARPASRARRAAVRSARSA